MALPPRPTSAPTTQTAAVAVAPAAAQADGDKIAPKRFAAAKDAAGNAIPVPQIAGVDLLAAGDALWTAIQSFLSNAGISIEEAVNALDAVSKEQFPGHKSGRIAYATADVIAQLGKNHALLTRTRSGVAPMTALKAKLEEKDRKLAEMEQKIAMLMAQMGK